MSGFPRLKISSWDFFKRPSKRARAWLSSDFPRAWRLPALFRKQSQWLDWTFQTPHPNTAADGTFLGKHKPRMYSKSMATISQVESFYFSVLKSGIFTSPWSEGPLNSSVRNHPIRLMRTSGRPKTQDPYSSRTKQNRRKPWGETKRRSSSPHRVEEEKVVFWQNLEEEEEREKSKNGQFLPSSCCSHTAVTRDQHSHGCWLFPSFLLAFSFAQPGPFPDFVCSRHRKNQSVCP